MRALSLLGFLLVLTTAAAADVKVTTKQIVTDPIFFETGKADIMATSYATLDHVAAAFRDQKIGLVEIGVHTDSRGRDKWNLELSEKRATAIYDYLVAKGVAATRLRAKGYGETRPLDKRANAAAWAKNRRTEFVILQRKTT
jgi:outer membrane protein OmpA-like peptidoglycan-associated protein